MRQYWVQFPLAGKRIDVPEGVTLLEAERLAGLVPDAPCGGNGTCGKCAVTIVDGSERRVVLACQTRVTSNLTVHTDDIGRSGQFLSAPASNGIPFDPPFTLRRDGNGETVSFEGRLLGRDTDGTPFSLLACDVGTTTLAVSLLDGRTGELLASAGALNPQASFGADVIGRIRYAGQHGSEALHTAVVSEINCLACKVCTAAGRRTDSILLSSFAGNPCMHHLLFGYDTASIGAAPYEPAKKTATAVPASDLGLSFAPNALALGLPNISGFVGGDTVACMLETGFDRLTEPTLLIDIGTNGELVLTDGVRRVCCAAAAGPAFEGASLHSGMRGMEGAIDHAWLTGGTLVSFTIGGAPAEGVCGSGLVDLVAALLDAGQILPGGRMLRSCPAVRVTEFEGQPAVLLSERMGKPPVLLTQKDVREVQLAKGAISAGILLLANRLGIAVSDIRRVLIAGAFGNYLDPKSACRIGLLPPELLGRISGIGNAACAGAIRILRSRSDWERADQLASDTEYLELSACPDFQDAFVDAMAFPEAL